MSEPRADEGFAPEDVAVMVDVLDRLAPDSTDPWDLLLKVTGSYRGADARFDRDPMVLFTERALAHGFEEDPKHPGCVVLGNRFSSATGDWPPAFEAVPETEKSAWAAVAAEVADSLPRAHFKDLVLSAGVQVGRDLGEEIAELYLELGARDSLDSYYRASCLRRALSVARQFHLDLEADVRRALHQMALSVDGMRGVPAGVLLQPLEALSMEPRTMSFTDPDREEVTRLLNDLHAAEGVDTGLLEGAVALIERIAASDVERESARRKLIDHYLAMAERSSGMNTAHWLEQAASTAQKFGLVQLRDRAVTAMQAMSIEDLGLEKQTFEFVIPRHFSDSRLGRYRRSRDALTSLDLWLTTPSPTGGHEDNLAQAKETSAGGILRLVTRTVFDANGLPVSTKVGPDNAAWEELERREAMNVGLYGGVLARELEAIKTEYGRPGTERVTAHLTSRYGCDAELASALSEAINSYWCGRHSDAGRTAFPLVEAGARGLLLALGEPLYRIQTGEAEGRFPSLEIYAERLEQRELDIDWLRCLRNPIADLRNALAHGHRFHLRDNEAAVLIRVAALFVTLTPADASAESRDQIELRLRDPIAWTATQARLVKRWRRVWAVDHGGPLALPRPGSHSDPESGPQPRAEGPASQNGQ